MRAGRATFISAAAVLVSVVAGCSDASDGGGTAAGGSSSGGAPSTGGAAAAGGSAFGGGGAPSGGTTNGGTTNGGAPSGGAPSGGGLGGGGAPFGGGGSSVGGGGCGASGGSDAGLDAAADAATDGGGGSSLTGVWYGSGHCLVLCANGRLFIADKLCTQTGASDFDTYINYTAAGTALTLTSSPSCWYNAKCASFSVGMAVNGNTATAQWCGLTLQMTLVGASSPLCDDPCRTAC